MNFFSAKNLIYLAFHGISFFLSIISILGIPGQLDESKPIVKTVTHILDFLLSCAWYGIPALFIATVVSFYFKFTLVGQLFSMVSLLIGISLFIGIIILYNVQ